MSDVLTIQRSDLKFAEEHLSDADTADTPGGFRNKYIVNEDGTRLCIFPSAFYKHEDVYPIFKIDLTDNVTRFYGGLAVFNQGHPIANGVAPRSLLEDPGGKYFRKAYNNPNCEVNFYPAEAYLGQLLEP